MKTAWITKSLGTVTSKIGSGATPLGGEEAYKATGIALIRSLNVHDHGFREIKLARIDDQQADRLSNVVVERNDVLLNITGASVARCCVVPDHALPARVNQHVSIIRPIKEKLNPTFLHYLLISNVYKDRLLQTGEEGGATRQAITKAQLQDFAITFPESLSEQQRIVEILEGELDGVALARANAEKNLQNARAIFDSHLESILTQRGPGWIDRTLDQVCLVERGSSPRPIKDYFTTNSDGVNWIKIGDTEEGGKYVFSTAQKITPEGAKQSRFVKEGDFILTNSMSFGRPYIMKTSGYIHDGWFVLRLNISIDTDYFYYLLSSNFVQSQFARLASGSVVKNISGDLVKRAILPIPPLPHQHIIVKRLLELSAETQRLASLYERKLAALDALGKSLLHQAFTGKL